MQRIKKMVLDNKLVKFIIVGGCSTGIDFIVYMFLSVKMSANIAKAISMVAASIFSYCANKKFTFRDDNKTNVGYLLRFYAVFAANLFVNILTNYIALKLTGHKIIAFIIATVCGMTVNYLGQKLFVFVHQIEDNGS